MTEKPQDERRGSTSASNAQADSLCEGRHQAQLGLPEEVSPEAASGTQIHAALAEQVREGQNVGSLASLTGEQRDIFDACREIEKKLIGAFFGDAPTKDNRVFREQRYWVNIKSGDTVLHHSGKPDVVVRRAERALVLDYKTGPAEAPDSPKNQQLRDLAVLVRGNLIVPVVGVAIVQPLATYTPDICLYDKPALDQAEKEMFERVRKSNAANPSRVAGEVQCKYCRAKDHCAAYSVWAGSQLPVAKPLPLPLISVPVVDWSPAQRTQFCESLSVITAAFKWVEDCKDHLKELLASDPLSVPGWSLKEGAKRESVTDAQAVFDRFIALGGKVEQFMPTVEVGKGKLKDALRAVTGAKGKGLDQSLSKLLQGCVEVKQNKPSLYRMEDSTGSPKRD